MATLYVTEQGARLEKEYQRLLVTEDDKVLLAVPLARISEVVLVGNVGATTPALLMLLDAEIPLSFITLSGKLRGRLAPPSAKNLALRHAQYDRARDPAFCLALARSIVEGKLRNALTLAHRLRRAHPQGDDPFIPRIRWALERIPHAPTLAELRGLEGHAARAYFGLWRRALRPDLAFGDRTRRPPRDPVNALLSLGYTLLTQNLMTACEVVGLDPYDGFYHADKYGRPALALDLMEEFRGIVVDSVTQRVVNKRIVAADDFRPGPGGGVYLEPPALRRFLKQYSERLNAEIIHPLAGRKLSYQRIFEVQARTLAKFVSGELDSYTPFRVR